MESEVDMVERIAAIIEPSAFKIKPRALDFDKTIAFVRQSEAKKKAAEIIRAMREPTRAMIATGVRKALRSTISSSYRWPDYIADLHRGMLDAALARSTQDEGETR